MQAYGTTTYLVKSLKQVPRGIVTVAQCIMLSKLTHLHVIKYSWEHAAPDMASQSLRKLLQEPCKEWQQQLQVLRLSLTEGAAIDLSGLSGL
jgi:hypothetical protein